MKNDSHDSPPEQQATRRVLRIDAVGMRIAQRRILHDRREQFAELGRWYDTDNECWCKERPV